MNTAGGGRPIIILGLDAGDLKLVDRWTCEGLLPNMQRMRKEGTWAPLDGIHDFNSFSVWPSFATGARASDHAYYSHMQLEPGSYELVATNSGNTMRLKPWWAQFRDNSLRSCIFDVPKIWPYPGVNGIQILEWGAKSPADNPRSDPPELVEELIRRYGIHRGTQLDEDIAENPAYFQRLLQALLESVNKRTEICLELMRRESWDLFIHVFSETHSVGHRFIHFLEGDTSRGGGHELESLRDGVKKVYQAIDQGIGRIRCAAPANTTFICCAMHGMGINENSEVAELVPELLRRYSYLEGDLPKPLTQRMRSSLFVAAHALVPAAARDMLKHHLSQAARKRVRLERLRRIHDQDNWPRMRAFSLPSDEGGFIRINLEGREPQGTVKPQMYEAVLEELTEIFQDLTDPSSGEKAVRKVRRGSDLQAGVHGHALPDLIVEWTQEPLRELESPRYGHLGRFYPHRAGTHRPRGYMIACGPQIPVGKEIEGGSVFDIPPTVLSLLGEPPQRQMVGQSLFGERGAPHNSAAAG